MVHLAPDTTYYFGSKAVSRTVANLISWHTWLKNVRKSQAFLLREVIDHNFWGAKADLLARDSLAIKHHNKKLTLKDLISGRAQASSLSVKPCLTTKSKTFISHLCDQAWFLPCLQTPAHMVPVPHLSVPLIFHHSDFNLNHNKIGHSDGFNNNRPHKIIYINA